MDHRPGAGSRWRFIDLNNQIDAGMKKLYITLNLLLVTGLITTQNTAGMAKTPNTGTETPSYTLLKDLGKIEIREYPELILASTEMGRTYSGNSGRGFSTVAAYIFGGNEKKQRISMTSPVVVDMADTMKMSFIMPSGFKMEDLPSPSNPEVELHNQSSRVLAVISFGGWANDSRLDHYRQLLKLELDKHGLKPSGDYMYFGYNPPYKLINRLNELAVEVSNPE